MSQTEKNHCVCSSYNGRLSAGILGLVLTVMGLAFVLCWEQILDHILSQKMILRPNSVVYDNWKNPPLRLTIDIYLFNWTNPEDFLNHSIKPILKQCGPYRFIENPDKVDIFWHPENSSVTYRRRSLYYFDVVGSQGQLYDEIITLNAVALSAARKAKHWDSARRKMVDVGLQLFNQELWVMKTVDELLFSGYKDELIDMARVMHIFGKDVEVPFDKFGWFYPRNGSAELTGVFTVYTGADDITKLGQMHSWNYKRHSGFYDSYCGFTNGSGGEFHPPHLSTESVVQLFTPDMCRTIPLDYVETVEVEGIKGYKYAGGLRSIDNGSVYAENRCFCGGECVPSGVMNISACRFGSPVFMSYPHFYQADDSYLKQVDGLQPSSELHEFFMILEPKTAVALEIAARFQVNMLIEPLTGISLYENVPRIFFPLIWFEQKVHISPEMAASLRKLPIAVLSGQIIAGIIAAIGCILCCWSTLSIILLHQKKSKCTQLDVNKENDVSNVKETNSRQSANPDDKFNINLPLI